MTPSSIAGTPTQHRRSDSLTQPWHGPIQHWSTPRETVQTHASRHGVFNTWLKMSASSTLRSERGGSPRRHKICDPTPTVQRALFGSTLTPLRRRELSWDSSTGQQKLRKELQQHLGNQQQYLPSPTSQRRTTR